MRAELHLNTHNISCVLLEVLRIRRNQRHRLLTLNVCENNQLLKYCISFFETKTFSFTTCPQNQVCETRTAKTFAKLSYEKGVVLARCPGCHNIHLIADRLG